MNEIQKEISIMDTREYYVINDVVMFTGLTDRTIRNYVYTLPGGNQGAFLI